MKTKGFTLIECLLALMVLSISLLMVDAIIKQIPQVNQQLSARKDQEWHIFLLQLERELAACTYISVTTYTLILHNAQNKTVTIDRINGVIRKRENNGYQPLLTEVSGLTYQKINESIRFTVTFENGEQKIGQWKIHTI